MYVIPRLRYVPRTPFPTLVFFNVRVTRKNDETSHINDGEDGTSQGLGDCLEMNLLDRVYSGGDTYRD